MNTFQEYLDSKDPKQLAEFLSESIDYQLTESEEAQIDDAVAIFLAEGKSIEDFEEEMTNEGLFGSIMGGLTGAALGKGIGRTIAKVLGIQKGVLYDLLTSRLVGAALGAAIGKKF
mgnify:CR=1 FL=1